MDVPVLEVFDHGGHACLVAPDHLGRRDAGLTPLQALQAGTLNGARALGIEGRAVGLVPVELSVDQGQTWRPDRSVRGAFRLDLTDLVKGRYGWRIRFRLGPDAGLDALTFTTVTQGSSLACAAVENSAHITASFFQSFTVIPRFGRTVRRVRRCYQACSGR